ncbi:MAG: hypothetical protein WBM08_14920 [Prochlorococcaceae cyanobacterium]
MAVFFSGTDDRSEISDPGMHVVVGAIQLQPKRSYEIKASVTASNKRFLVGWEQLIDATPMEDCLYHEDVPSYITTEARRGPVPGMPLLGGWQRDQQPFMPEWLDDKEGPGYSWTPRGHRSQPMGQERWYTSGGEYILEDLRQWIETCRADGQLQAITGIEEDLQNILAVVTSFSTTNPTPTTPSTNGSKRKRSSKGTTRNRQPRKTTTSIDHDTTEGT